MEDVAKTAGISKAAIYLYFPSKMALLEALIEAKVSPLANQAQALAAAGRDDPLLALRTLATAAAHLMSDAKVIAVPRLVISISGRFPEIADYYRTHVVEKARTALEALIKAGIAKGVFRAVDAKAAARAFIGPLFFEAMWTHVLRGESAFTDPQRLIAQHFGAEAASEVAYTGFQAGFGHAHHVVVRHGPLGAQVGQREQAAIAALHHLATGFGQGDQAVGADIMGNAKAFAGGDFGEVAVQLVARGETDRVNDAVQAVPLLAQGLEHRDDFFIAGHITREAQFGVGAPACRELFDPPFEFLVLISEGQFCAFSVHGRGDTRGDGQFAGNANDQYALTA
jgi:AcrR family transcriptional regulator